MIAENRPVKPPAKEETPPRQARALILTARSLVTPVAPEIWMRRWQPDDEIWKTASRAATSS